MLSVPSGRLRHTVEAHLAAHAVPSFQHARPSNPQIRRVVRIVAQPVGQAGRFVATAGIGAGASCVVVVWLAVEAEAGNLSGLRD